MASSADSLSALRGGVLDPVSTQRVSDVIAERLARASRDGALQPGDRLPTEQELAREFRVGRTSVREGLQKLRAHGLIESRKGLGAFVTEPQPEDPLADFARWTKRDPVAAREAMADHLWVLYAEVAEAAKAGGGAPALTLLPREAIT